MKSYHRTYYSNGKLLLTGEYVVLDGALSLALPCTYGQYLTVTPVKTPKIQWKSLDEKDTIWFTMEIDTKHLLALCHENHTDSSPSYSHTPMIRSSHEEIGNTLLNILKHAQQLNPYFLHKKNGYDVTTKLTFPRNWGLGSSSTLINNIAQWANVNAYELLNKSFMGSGYDIACAQYNCPILYQIKAKTPIVTPATFCPPFYKQLYFIHLNTKQNSREGIARYRNIEGRKDAAIRTLSNITKEIQSANTLHTFEMLLEAHENYIADLLQLPKVSTLLFNDYFGIVKSLGAWGGDFVLATGNEDTPNYFRKKGFHTIIPYHEMILPPL